MRRIVLSPMLALCLACDSTSPNRHALDAGTYLHQLDIPQLNRHFVGTVTIVETDENHFTSIWAVPGYPASVYGPWDSAKQAYTPEIHFTNGGDFVTLRLRRSENGDVECAGTVTSGGFVGGGGIEYYDATCSLQKQ